MAIKHVNDEKLGVFDYDDTQFQMRTLRTANGDKQCLKYIGAERDGNNITIPDGIEDIKFMFDGSNIVIPPKIPSSVKSMNFAFRSCRDLKDIPEIPYGVYQARGTFMGCKALTTTEHKLPKSIKYASEMFAKSSIEEINLPEYLSDANDMFAGCRKLRCVTGKIGKDIANANGMFQHCDALLEQPEFDENVTNLKETQMMFHGCTALEFPKPLPKCVEKSNSMYRDCNNLKMIAHNDGHIKSAAHMYEGCDLSNNTETLKLLIDTSINYSEHYGNSHNNIFSNTHVTSTIPVDIKILHEGNDVISRKLVLFRAMYSNCAYLKNIDESTVDLINIAHKHNINISNMFTGCTEIILPEQLSDKIDTLFGYRMPNKLATKASAARLNSDRYISHDENNCRKNIVVNGFDATEYLEKLSDEGIEDIFGDLGN